MTCSPQAGGTAGHVPPNIDFEASAAHLVGGIDELHPFVRDGQDYGWDLLHVLRGFLQKEEHSSEQWMDFCQPTPETLRPIQQVLGIWDQEEES